MEESRADSAPTESGCQVTPQCPSTELANPPGPVAMETTAEVESETASGQTTAQSEERRAEAELDKEEEEVWNVAHRKYQEFQHDCGDLLDPGERPLL